MTTAPHTTPLFRTLTLVLGCVTVLSALGGIGLALSQRPTPAWFLLMFEGPVALAGVFAILLARGSRFGGTSGPAMTLLCIAGCVGAGSVMGYIGTGHEAAGIRLTKALLARLVLAGGFGSLAALCVLLRRPARSLPLLFKGVALGLPLPIVALLVSRGIGVAQFNALPEFVQIVAYLLGAVVLGGLFCASVHVVIRAFQIGIDEEPVG